MGRNDKAGTRIDDDIHDLTETSGSYEKFRKKVEHDMGYHDSIHNTIGGHMASGFSANDPIFYTHHGNIDKIWRDWQTQSDEHIKAYVGKTTKKDEPMFAYAGKAGTPKHMRNSSHLIYKNLQGEEQIINVEYVDMDTSPS